MSSVSEGAGQPAAAPAGERAGKSRARVAAAMALTLVGVLLLVVAVVYVTEPAKSLPSFLGHIQLRAHNAKRADAKRPLHGVAAFIVAVVFFVFAYFTYSWKSAPPDAGSS